MKRILPVMLSLALVAITGAMRSYFVCAAESSSISLSVGTKSVAVKKYPVVVFKTRLHCDNCVKKVVENLSFVKGVKDLEVSLDNQEVMIVYDSNKTDVKTLAIELEKLGYPSVIKFESNK